MFSDLFKVNMGTSMDREVTADTEAESEAQRKRFETPMGRTLSLGGAESSGKLETRKHERVVKVFHERKGSVELQKESWI